MLNTLCGNASATCSFTPTSQERLYGPHHVIGKEVANNTPLVQKTVIEEGDEVSLTHSVSVTASAKVTLIKVVELSLSATYGHSWTSTHTFKQTEHLDIPANHKGWLQGVEPIIRDTGDFTLTMGEHHVEAARRLFRHPRPHPWRDRREGGRPADPHPAGRSAAGTLGAVRRALRLVRDWLTRDQRFWPSQVVLCVQPEMATIVDHHGDCG